MEKFGEQSQPGEQDGPHLVVAVFYEDDRVAAAIVKLEEIGFDRNEIDVATRDLPKPISEQASSENSVMNGATTGVFSGGMVGGVFGLLMAVSAVIPELSTLLLADVLGVTLTGIGVGAASGGVLGSIIGYRVSAHSGDAPDLELFKGGILVVVDAGGRNDEAKSALIESGGDLGPTNVAEALGSDAERRAYFS